MSEEQQKKTRKPRTSKKNLVVQSSLVTTMNAAETETETPTPTPTPTETENVIMNLVKDDSSKIKLQEPKIPKKRGRKPKGGKIIQNNTCISIQNVHEPNIILHLKCIEQDLYKNKFNSNLEYQPTIESVETFQFDNTKTNDLGYSMIEYGSTSGLNKATENNSCYIINENEIKPIPNAKMFNTKESTYVKEIDETQCLWDKLKELTYQLHTNTITDKKSACFWCTCDFDNPMILIPKYELNKTYHCYGCFCSPECASAFLFKESIDNSTKFERYHLLNHIYCKIYNYEKNIKPAPDPFYMLNKYYGNLSIQEYRKLLKNERLLLVVDKPLSRILPELHEDNDDMMASGSMISTSNKFKLRRKVKQSKTEILSETFNLH